MCWLFNFWPSDALSVDNAFQKGVCKEMLDSHGTSLHNVTLRGHSKNVLELKYFVIRSIYICLCRANHAMSKTDAPRQSIRVSNEMYGNTVLSAFKMACVALQDQ